LAAERGWRRHDPHRCTRRVGLLEGSKCAGRAADRLRLERVQLVDDSLEPVSTIHSCSCRGGEDEEAEAEAAAPRAARAWSVPDAYRRGTTAIAAAADEGGGAPEPERLPAPLLPPRTLE
jgi:hypothetical protein